jgi:hypothetical protein
VNIGRVTFQILTTKFVLAGQVAGVSSVEFGLANMIWAAVVIAKVNTGGRRTVLWSLTTGVYRTVTMSLPKGRWSASSQRFSYSMGSS